MLKSSAASPGRQLLSSLRRFSTSSALAACRTRITSTLISGHPASAGCWSTPLRCSSLRAEESSSSGCRPASSCPPRVCCRSSRARTGDSTSRPALVLIAICIGLVLGLASWWTPFGWTSYGPRLSLPWVLPLVLMSVVAYGDVLAPLTARLLAPTWRLLTIFAVVFCAHAPGRRRDVASELDRCLLRAGGSLRGAMERWHSAVAFMPAQAALARSSYAALCASRPQNDRRYSHGFRSWSWSFRLSFLAPGRTRGRAHTPIGSRARTSGNAKWQSPDSSPSALAASCMT